jgi:hypothetical protein
MQQVWEGIRAMLHRLFQIACWWVMIMGVIVLSIPEDKD